MGIPIFFFHQLDLLVKSRGGEGMATHRAPAPTRARPPPISEVSSSSGDPTWQSTLGARSGGGGADPMAEEDRKLHPDEEIESFFGQLWAVHSLPSRHQPRVPGSVGFLAWVRKDLVREGRITIEECHPVKKSD
ncbi:hypothetical protein PVAP13_9NG657466 [Panicum virgatum]|uniref:Uncharacterized protein n=1 Tax=Panicum virgatum TaxID=38727 RepID=A0A8T0N1I1_PANVG|nr:hypothetical protein PVAP13_9NG657466 [Panicum virgatum]